MNDFTFTFKSKLWLYQGKGAWFFITLPKDDSARIKFFFSSKKRRGWGSVRVTVTIGETRWKTSIFPDSKSGAFLLPIKADVRKAENLKEGSNPTVTIAVDT